MVIFTDSEYATGTYGADVMASTLKERRRCSVLQVIDEPIADAQISMPAVVNSLLDTYGKRFTYLLAANGAYITGARVGLFGAGVQGDQPPFSVAAADDDASEFGRSRAGNYQEATVAEPLYLQGWQLIDEMNRARAAAVRLRRSPTSSTHADVPSGAVFDSPSGYRENYLRISRG